MKIESDIKIIPNILIVDDNPHNIFAMKSLLEHMPVKLYEALSGNEALDLLMQQEFALVLLDVQMPDMDGFEIAGLMRMNKRTKEIPIIFVTAISKEEQYIKKGLQIGAVDYLFKPVDPIILMSKVSVFINYYIQKKQMDHMVAKLNQSQNLLTKKNESLNHLARTDVLTGLENRLNFEEILERTIQSSKIDKKMFTLIFLDLDNFKYVNDAFGHDCGDILLKEVAERLKKVIRNREIVSHTRLNDYSISRLGGDEFAILLIDISDMEVAGKIANRIIESLAKPFVIQGNEAHISASIGIAYYPMNGDTAELLMKHADVAMYQAKNAGKNQFQYFSEIIHKDQQYLFQVESFIKQALEKNEFYLVYQPILNLSTKELVAVEALCRWRNDVLGEVTPDVFIPIAEGTGLICQLGQWILQTAVLEMKHCYDLYHISLHCHVNLSTNQMLDNEFVSYVQSMMQMQLLKPESLTFELTETALMKNAQILGENLNTLSKLGFHISADDFGMGYSSLSRLVLLPISSLKIDKTFVQTITEQPQNESSIINSILELAKNLNLVTIAEGIETQEQFDFLLKHQCQYGQGYLLAKPMPADELHLYLQKLSKDHTVPLPE